MEGLNFSTAVDLSIGYYHIKLDAYAKNLCTIAFPWDMRKLQMQMLSHWYQDCLDPDVFQNVISDIVQDIYYVRSTMQS
jgi:hypothetical protein